MYLDCGPVILGLLDYSGRSAIDVPTAEEAIYLATAELEEIHRRASALGCLTKGLLHDDPESPLGRIVVRPWGERSFYVEDPSGNSLCFVDDRTLFTGTPEPAEALRRTATDPPSAR